MKAILWRALHFAASASAVLFIATCALWVRSWRVAEADVLEFSRRDVRWSIESHAGRVRLSNDLECKRRRAQMQLLSLQLARTSRPIPVLWDGMRMQGEQQKLSGWDWDAVQMQEREAARARAALDEARSRAALAPVEHSLQFGTIAAAAALLPAALFLRSIVTVSVRRHRRRRGFCPTCGYDLRATPDV